MKKFLIIGCGSIGRRHAATLLERNVEVIAYNRNPERRQAMARDLGVEVFDDLDTALNQGCDAAVIATANTLHLEHSLAAARTGHHLFIEKPVSHALDGLDSLRTVVNQNGLITHVGSNMRFHFGPKTIRDHLDDGTLGRPLWATLWGGMHLPDWHPEEDYRQMYSALNAQGGGALRDFIHEIDLALWMFSTPRRVAAMLSRSGWLEIETEDVVDILLGYDTPLQVSLHLDYLQKPFQRGIRVVGDQGWIHWNLNNSSVERHLYAGEQTVRLPYPAGYSKQSMYDAQMDYFLTCLEKRTPSFCGLEQGISALKLVAQAQRSHETNRFHLETQP
ncbi:MAG: Gfo/Idh/MocA family oxidoreductase [Magnetococcales bacterium]|nr:Gfo/Idh/MocA family oxidoreductase [Magnetococcales bacterium]